MSEALLFTPEQDEIYLISLWQPWAQWVMWGLKPIETRLHARFKNLAGHRVGIHAADKWDVNCTAAKPYLSDTDWRETMEIIHRVPRGKLLGTVQVDETRWLTPADAPRALIECDTNRFGLIVSDPRLLPEPITMRGQQGMWRFKLPEAKA